MFRSCLVAAALVLASGQVFAQVELKAGVIVKSAVNPTHPGYKVLAVDGDDVFAVDLRDHGKVLIKKERLALGVAAPVGLAVGDRVRLKGSPANEPDRGQLVAIKGTDAIVRTTDGMEKPYPVILLERSTVVAVKPAPKVEPLKPAPTPPAAQGGPIAGEVVDGATIRIPDGKGAWYLVPANDASLLTAVRARIAGGGSYTTCPNGNCGQAGFGYRR